jgi:hypothetical protein
MWAYKVLRKDTRWQIPKFRIFLKQNNDFLKFWCEEEWELPEDRINFLLRFLRFICYFFLLFVFVNIIINPKDSYYNSQCAMRYLILLIYTVERTVTMPALMDSFQSLTAKIYQS